MYTLNPSSWDKNHIHGGTVGFDKKLWVGNIITNGVELFYSSPGNDEQFSTVEKDVSDIVIHFRLHYPSPTPM